MCFYNDYDADWSAEVNDEAEAESGPATKCDECGAAIAATDWRWTLHQQEHGGCQICEDEFSDDFISKESIEEEIEGGDLECAAKLQKQLDEHTHVYGETFDYVRCRGCDQLLKAIERREELAGCPVDSRRPALLDLRENLEETSERLEYIEQAVSMFPELWSHPFVVAAIA